MWIQTMTRPISNQLHDCYNIEQKFVRTTGLIYTKIQAHAGVYGRKSDPQA